MIINGIDLLEKAKANKKTIFHFNARNLEMVRCILEASNEVNKPVILGFSESTIKYIGGYKTAANIVKNLIEELNINVDVVLHLDHGSSVESCVKAIKAGFSSVMYDGSKETIENNIKNTKDVVGYAISENIAVEGELGYIGTSLDELTYTNLDDAIKYVRETEVNSFAASVGTAHGLYSKIPEINYELIEKLNKNLEVPLVLHGGSNLSDDVLKQCVLSGISKINIDTELQIVWAKALRKYLTENPDAYDPRKIIISGKEAIKNKIKEYLNLFD